MLTFPHFGRIALLRHVVILFIGGLSVASGQPFVLEGLGVDTNDFRVTVFATGLNAPMGMARLSDGSLLVTVSGGANYFSTAGSLLRLTDTNHDGVADGPGTVLYSGLPPTPTAVCVASNLVLVTGSGKPVTILRGGATPSSPLSFVGQFGFAFPSPPSWGHQNVALAVRTVAGFTNRFHVLWQIGSQFNAAPSTNTVALTNLNISGATGTLQGDSVYRLTLIDGGVNVTATDVVQIASGLRNASGLTFNPTNGDLYIAENGIDGYGAITNREAFSADELDYVASTNLGVTVPFFGFPSNYVTYRSGTVVGGEGVAPLVAFQPIPDPYTGAESEGPNQAAFAPPGFPTNLSHGVFVAFHGQFSWGGTTNEENPLVFANPATGEYFHFIRGQQAGIGHLDGLFATEDSLFVADCATNGNLSSSAGQGVIYQIKSLLGPPIITQHPLATNVCPGLTAMFSVTATGDGTLTYQWQTNGVSVSNNSHYAGCTNNVLWVTNVSSVDAVNYRCVLTDAFGSTNSGQAALTLKTATEITQHPSATNVCAGATTTFSVAAVGEGTVTYQWQKDQTNISNGGHYSGVTTAILTITGADASDAGNYRCVATAGCGDSTSFQAGLTIKAATTITQQPVSQGVPMGSNATFSVTATGDGTLAYQWLKNGTNLNNGGHYSGATTASLTINGVDANDLAGYQCVVNGGCGSLTSSNAVLLNEVTSTYDFAVNRVIPEGSIGVSDTRTITNSAQALTSVKVKLKVSGGYNGDLYCYLRRATGHSVLLNRVGRTTGKPFGYGDPGLDMTFDDGANNDVHTYRVTLNGNPDTPLGTNLAGSWGPDGRTTSPAAALDTDARTALLNTFTNQNPNGEWTLFIADTVVGDTHTLVSWGLEISSGEQPTLPVAGVDVRTRSRGLDCKINIASLLTNDTGNSVYFAGLTLTTTNGVTLTTNATTIFYSNPNDVEDRLTYQIRDSYGNLTEGVVLIQIAGSSSSSLTIVQLQTDVPGLDTNTLTLAGIPGYEYVLQFATNEPASQWFNLSTNIAGVNGLWTVQDPTATNFQRFYRVSTP